eukprot:scaffold65394_cov27-Tisochrysis_lutea.AAC.4
MPGQLFGRAEAEPSETTRDQMDPPKLWRLSDRHGYRRLPAQARPVPHATLAQSSLSVDIVIATSGMAIEHPR